MYRIALHVYNGVEQAFDLCMYWADDIPDICAMVEMVPTAMDILTLNEDTMTYAYGGDEIDFRSRSI
jgi:hypothetical protein